MAEFIAGTNNDDLQIADVEEAVKGEGVGQFRTEVSAFADPDEEDQGLLIDTTKKSNQTKVV